MDLLYLPFGEGVRVCLVHIPSSEWEWALQVASAHQVSSGDWEKSPRLHQSWLVHLSVWQVSGMEIPCWLTFSAPVVAILTAKEQIELLQLSKEKDRRTREKTKIGEKLTKRKRRAKERRIVTKHQSLHQGYSPLPLRLSYVCMGRKFCMTSHPAAGTSSQ